MRASTASLKRCRRDTLGVRERAPEHAQTLEERASSAQRPAPRAASARRLGALLRWPAAAASTSPSDSFAALIAGVAARRDRLVERRDQR
jgi:hypothetical protein